MRYVLIALLPIFLIGCSGTDGEPERTPERKPERKLSVREVRVQALIEQLANESSKNRQAAYAELRDTFVRKRDIPELTKEIARNANPEVKTALRKLITYIKEKWRLPDKGWTTDIDECSRRYEKEFQDLGCDLVMVVNWAMGKEYLLTLHVHVLDVPIENRTRVINLILTLEPESLVLLECWANIAFLGTLANLQKLDLQSSKVTDLTPLKGLPNLRYLDLWNTGVADLTPLKGLPELRILNLGNTRVTDLTPLKGLPKLVSLHLANTKVSDLTPLKGLPVLIELWLQDTGVIDLTPLKGLPELRILNLRNTKVSDLTPLKELPLMDLYLKNTRVTDLTSLKGMPNLEIIEK